LPPLKLPADTTAERDTTPVTWLGATVRNIAGEGEMSAFGLPGVTGVLILEFPAGSALAKAGLRKNDVILFVNGGKTADTAALLRQVSELPAGNSVKLGVSRDQNEIVVELVR
jgi:serine protease DegQ